MVSTNLPPKERMQYFRRLASEAERAARSARGEQREAYRRMAKQWRKLAEDVEARKQKEAR